MSSVGGAIGAVAPQVLAGAARGKVAGEQFRINQENMRQQREMQRQQQAILEAYRKAQIEQQEADRLLKQRLADQEAQDRAIRELENYIQGNAYNLQESGALPAELMRLRSLKQRRTPGEEPMLPFGARYEPAGGDEVLVPRPPIEEKTRGSRLMPPGLFGPPIIDTEVTNLREQEPERRMVPRPARITGIPNIPLDPKTEADILSKGASANLAMERAETEALLREPRFQQLMAQVGYTRARAIWESFYRPEFEGRRVKALEDLTGSRIGLNEALAKRYEELTKQGWSQLDIQRDRNRIMETLGSVRNAIAQYNAETNRTYKKVLQKQIIQRVSQIDQLFPKLGLAAKLKLLTTPDQVGGISIPRDPGDLTPVMDAIDREIAEATGGQEGGAAQPAPGLAQPVPGGKPTTGGATRVMPPPVVGGGFTQAQINDMANRIDAGTADTFINNAPADVREQLKAVRREVLRRRAAKKRK